MLPGTRFEDIDEKTIHGLISDKEPESQYLEYKQKPWDDTSKDRKESLYDVTALANAYGGTILLGIRTDGDIPVEIVGVENAAAVQSNLQKRAIASIDPRIPGLRIRVVQASGKDVVVIYVPRSGRSPHMVTLEGTNKFYRRHGKDKLLMSVDEIGDAFLLTGHRVEHGLSTIQDHQRAVSVATSVFPSLCLGTLPLLHYPRPIEVTEPWVSELLSSPPHPTGEPLHVDNGIGSMSQYDEIVPTLDGLVRRRRSGEHLFRLAMGRNGLLSFRTTDILVRGRNGPSEIDPRLLVSKTVHFFRVSQALVTHLGFQGEIASYLSLEHLMVPERISLRQDVPMNYIEWGRTEFLVASELDSIAPEPLTWDSASNPDQVAFRLLNVVYNAFHFPVAPLFRDGKYDATASSA